MRTLRILLAAAVIWAAAAATPTPLQPLRRGAPAQRRLDAVGGEGAGAESPEALRESTARVMVGDGSAAQGATVSSRNSNLCTALDPALVIYNRIPKAGSTSVLKLIQEQQRAAQSFDYVHSTDMHDHGATEVLRYLQASALAARRTLYDRHQFFLRGVDRATWINLMRDPVARATSSYYYSRYSEGLSIAQRQKNLDKYGAQSLDECVARPRSEWGACGVRNDVAVRFFCGVDTICDSPGSVEAYELAQQHIRNRYAVVGVIERLDEFLELLERRLPRYFAGIGGIKAELAGQQSDKVHANSNPHPQPSPETVERLRRGNAADYALYKWVGKRMTRMLKDCRTRVPVAPGED